MAELKVKDIAKALYEGRIETFSKGELNEQEGTDIVTNAILEVCDCKEKFNMNKFMDNRYKVFQILEEVLTEPMQNGVVPQYQEWVDIANVGYNETYAFKTLDNELFRVGVVANGTHDFHRQRLMNGRLNMSGFMLGLKIYEEFHALRTGQVNFTEMVSRVRESFDAEIMSMIVKMIQTSYNGLDTKFVVKGSYDETKLLGIVDVVEAKSKKKAVIYGTRTALRNLAGISELDKQDIRENGYLRIWNGIKCVIIPQALDSKDDFIVDNKTLFIIPDGTKIVKLLMEGEPEVREVDSEEARDDQQFEFAFMQRIQIGVAKSSIYGMYVIQ